RERIQGRGVGGDALDLLASSANLVMQTRQEEEDVAASGVAIQHLEEQAPLLVGIDGGEDAEGAVIQFVHREVTGEPGQRLVEVSPLDVLFSFFPPPPRPSSGWWRRGR